MIYSFLTPYKKTPYTEGWGEKIKYFPASEYFLFLLPPIEIDPVFL